MPTYIKPFEFWMVRLTKAERSALRQLVTVNSPIEGLDSDDFADFRDALAMLSDGIDLDQLSSQDPTPNLTQKAFAIIAGCFGTDRATAIFSPTQQ